MRPARGASPSDPGSTHWSCQMSKSWDLEVQRILVQAQLKPHRLERYLASDDPDFNTKAADIIGLYLDPPRHAVVCSVWMKDRDSGSGSDINEITGRAC